MTDSELATLQEKVKRLIHDRDIAVKLADRASELLRETKIESENYRQLWEAAVRTLNSTTIPKQ